MALAHSPKIVTDGLVLCLDAGNFKSFKGEATTNELVSVTWSGDGSAQSGMPFGSAPVTDENLKYKGYETYLWSPGTSLNCYLNGADVSSSRTSTVWTFSCYIKREDGGPITSLNVYMYYPNSDGSGNGTIQNVGNGWYRVSRTRTGTDSYIALAGFTGFASGYKYYLSGAQLEKKPYPTTVVATNTTRGTTVVSGGGWTDLSRQGNHGELVNGVRESSDNGGSLSFDGVDDYINFTNPGLSNEFSLEAWVRPTNFPANVSEDNGIFGTTTNAPRCQFDFNEGPTPGTNTNLRFFDSGLTPNNLELTLNVSDVINTWSHVCVTRSGTTTTLYLDGSILTSGTQTGSANSNLITKIGTSYTAGSQYFEGNISTAKIYNRALTPQEIQQNFNALRGRYGI